MTKTMSRHNFWTRKAVQCTLVNVAHRPFRMLQGGPKK